MTTKFHRGAKQDLAGGHAWYGANGGPEVAEKFLQAVEVAASKLSPSWYTRVRVRGVDETVYRAPVKRFPNFSIIFVVKDKTNFIVAVEHSSRIPLYWKHRLDSVE